MSMRYRYAISYITPDRNDKVIECDDWAYNDVAGFFLFQKRKDPYQQSPSDDIVIYAVSAHEVFELTLLPEVTDAHS